MYWISHSYQTWCLSTPLALFFQCEWTVFASLPGEAVLSAKLLAKKKTLRAIFTCPLQARCRTHCVLCFILTVLITLCCISRPVWGFDVEIKFHVLVWGELKMMDRIDIEKFLLVM